MVLVCQLFQTLSKRLEWPRRKLSIDEIFILQRAISDWLATCPRVYKTTGGVADTEPKYVNLQRWNLQVVAYMLMLQPLRSFLTTPLTLGSPSSHHDLQVAAIQCAVCLVNASSTLAEAMTPFSANFHTAMYTIFDTAAVLCSSILHDVDSSLPWRPQILETIGRAVRTLKRLSQASDTATTAYKALSQLIENMALRNQDRSVYELGLCVETTSHISQPHTDTPTTSIPKNDIPTSAPFSFSKSLGENHDTDHSSRTSMDGTDSSPLYNLAGLQSFDLGSLAEIWGWESLNF